MRVILTLAAVWLASAVTSGMRGPLRRGSHELPFRLRRSAMPAVVLD